MSIKQRIVKLEQRKKSRCPFQHMTDEELLLELQKVEERLSTPVQKLWHDPVKVDYGHNHAPKKG